MSNSQANTREKVLDQRKESETGWKRRKGCKKGEKRNFHGKAMASGTTVSDQYSALIGQSRENSFKRSITEFGFKLWVKYLCTVQTLYYTDDLCILIR